MREWNPRMLARWRRLNGLSMREAARRCNISVGMWSVVERGYQPLSRKLEQRILMGSGVPERFWRMTDSMWVKRVRRLEGLG